MKRMKKRYKNENQRRIRRLSIRGRRGYLSFYRDIRVRKSGTSMKLLVLGGLYLIMASAREDHSSKVEKRQNSDSYLNCICGWRNEAAVVIWKSEKFKGIELATFLRNILVSRMDG